MNLYSTSPWHSGSLVPCYSNLATRHSNAQFRFPKLHIFMLKSKLYTSTSPCPVRNILISEILKLGYRICFQLIVSQFWLYLFVSNESRWLGCVWLSLNRLSPYHPESIHTIHRPWSPFMDSCLFVSHLSSRKSNISGCPSLFYLAINWPSVL